MADTTVEVDVRSVLDRSLAPCGPYWTDTNTAVVVYIDSSSDLAFTRTTDGGSNWAETVYFTGTVQTIGCWFDQETPGESGTLLHTVWVDSGSSNLHYRTIDVSDGSLGTERTIDSTITPGASPQGNHAVITKTLSGNLLVALDTGVDSDCYRSSDGFNTSNDSRTAVSEGAQADWILLFPANTGDDNDACALFWDATANTISIKMYDDSANTWTETDIDTDATEDGSNINMDAAVRHSDNHLLMAYNNNDDHASSDLKTADLTVDSIASPTITAKANIFTDQGESAQASVFINQNNDHVYVAYMKGGTWTATVDVVYHRSTDGMSNWDSESAYSEDTADDIRSVHAGRTVGSNGGRYQPVFYNADLTQLYVNETNDVELTVSVAIPNVIYQFNQAVNRAGTY